MIDNGYSPQRTPRLSSLITAIEEYLKRRRDTSRVRVLRPSQCSTALIALPLM
jgi:hypothetical protein